MKQRYDEDKQFLENIRTLNEAARMNKARRRLIREQEEEKGDAIPITNDVKFGDNVLDNQIKDFKTVVNLGAKFAGENPDKAENNPLVYYPKTGNIVFTGSIPSLSNLKFQYSLNDVTGAPYIFVDGLALTDDVINTLNKMKGHFENWRDSWLSESDLLDKMGKKED